ncbi:hypothetical protein BSN85_22250 [Bradyrhizobium brasilense]|nr:hypothetical protein BSN85_22250 [Bradyrhizobium brasilense]
MFHRFNASRPRRQSARMIQRQYRFRIARRQAFDERTGMDRQGQDFAGSVGCLFDGDGAISSGIARGRRCLLRGRTRGTELAAPVFSARGRPSALGA